MSLTITAHLNSSSECLDSSTCFSKVVFPAPRKPHSRDTGKILSGESSLSLTLTVTSSSSSSSMLSTYSSALIIDQLSNTVKVDKTTLVEVNQ